jgi:hypothetical protein
MGVKIYKEGHTYPIYWAKKVGIGVWSSISVYVEGSATFTCPTGPGLDETYPEGVFVSTPNGSENTIYPRDYESIKDGKIVPGNLNLDTRVSVSNDTVTFFLRNDHEGEWIYTISVYGDDGESELKIGVEVEGEKENLGITMENLGVNYSLDTILSVWRGDPREELPDWAIINEKRREVLETIDLYAQKGSYRHLRGIFDWLEFPGETYELTRHWTEDGYRYSRQPIGHPQAWGGHHGGWDKTDLKHKTRTTLIAAEIDTDRTWEYDDLRLKMWQIGNSLEKDLLPIHLDVHHSCVISEAKGKVELLYDHSNSTHTELSSEEDFDIAWRSPEGDQEWGGSDLINPDNPPSILIREVNGVVGPWNTIEKEWPESFEEMPNLFHSLGATIRGTMKFPEKVIRGSKDGEIREFSSNELTFTFLYERPGEYHHTFQFTGESGKTYTRVVKIEVVDTVNVSIEFLGIDRKDRNPFLVPTDYAISIERVLEEKQKFKVYASLPLDEVHYYQLPESDFEEYKRDKEAYAHRLERLNPDWWIDFPTVMSSTRPSVQFVAKGSNPKPIQCPSTQIWTREVFLPGFYDTRPAGDKEDVLILRPKIEGGLHWSLPDCRWKIQSLQDLTVHNFHGMRSLVLGYNSASPLKKGRHLVELSYNWGSQRTTKAISPYLLG